MSTTRVRSSAIIGHPLRRVQPRHCHRRSIALGADLASVGISIQCASTGLYLSGGTFGSARSAWITASGTTSWNLPLATATFPTDGNYTVTVRHRYNRQRKQQQHKPRHRPRKTAAARLTTTNTTGGLQLFARPEWLPGINPHETPASHGQGVGLRYSEAEFFGGGYCGEFDEFDVVFFQHFQDLVRGYSEELTRPVRCSRIAVPTRIIRTRSRRPPAWTPAYPGSPSGAAAAPRKPFSHPDTRRITLRKVNLDGLG